MEYKEAPCVQNVNRKLVFPLLKWLDKKKFLDYIDKNMPIYPFLHQHNDETTNERIFVGKSIQNCLDEGVRYGYDYRLCQKEINLEIIGSVLRNEAGEWVLHVPHSSSVCEIKQDFLVLCIDDPNAFRWVKTRGGLVPKYALKACIDRLTNEYFYVGKPNREDSSAPEFFRDMKWNKFDESMPYHLFGKVHATHKCLYVPFNNLELFFSAYDILCLKPSPSPLKILCRTRIRELVKNSDEKMRLINTNKSGRRYVPDSMLKFIFFPHELKVGEYMLKGEKIVRQDGKFEFLIEQNGDLVCQSVIQNKNELSTEEARLKEDEQIKRIIYSDVDSVWLHRFQVAFYKTNTRVRVDHSFYDTSPEYKLYISKEDNASYKIE